MYDYSLLIGNGINNLSEGYSWDDVLKGLGDKYKIDINTNEKPFPLAYEEIYFKILKRKGNGNNENDIKNFIAEKIKKITANEIHQAILELNCQNIMTTNYDLAFEDVLKKETKTTHLNNKGIIKEQRYNVFRHHELSEKKIWHIHGDITVPNSITLGYEHYSGHLQSMRNYTTSGSHYKKSDFDQSSLISRHKKNVLTPEYSWIDNFFLRDIYVIGLTLDFVEIDLWWLLTFRERNKYMKKLAKEINNNITYYLPACFLDASQCKEDDIKRLKVKTELLESVGVHINKNFGMDFKRSKVHEKNFYLHVVNDIRNQCALNS
ncbi:SIR2 family protein [Citrobacter portucalensis]|uniref:SIR2 family protein n=1 Tax=Citrobacter portucalensis TaxID=1639133 RepID=UPI00226B1580|nr:SIR2 family protein [Citrobacter portucalensis]MCX9056937.1 SIR2 family protein [Citrobacter portucalensis]